MLGYDLVIFRTFKVICPYTQHILRSSAKSLIQAEQEAAIMAYISLKYEEAAIHAEVLSAFEVVSLEIGVL